MKKILFTVVLNLLSILLFGQSSEKMVQITAPEGYRIYYNSELKGITSAEMDGLTFYTELSSGILMIKKQNKTIINQNLSINKKITEFNLYDYLSENSTKSTYDYWQKLFDLYGNNNYSVKDYRERNIVLIMSQFKTESKKYLNTLKSDKLEEPIKFDEKLYDGFYYGKLKEATTITGKKDAFFILFFLYNAKEDIYIAYLRIETSARDMNSFVNSIGRDRLLNDIDRVTTYSKFYYLFATSEKDFTFYPALGYLHIFFRINYDVSIQLELAIIEDEMLFEWAKSSVSEASKFANNPNSGNLPNSRFSGILQYKKW